MIWTITILIILLLIAGFIIYNLYNQNRQFVEYLDNFYEEEERFLLIYNLVLKILVHTKIEMEKIDYRGSFRTDDEVGFSFKALQACIDTVATEIDKIKNGKEDKND